MTSLRCNRSAPIQQSDARVTTSLASEAEVAPRVTIPHTARLQPSSETGSTATVLASIFRPSPEFAPPRSPFLVVEERRAGQLRLNRPSLNLRSGPSASPPHPPACLSSSAQHRPRLYTEHKSSSSAADHHHLILVRAEQCNHLGILAEMAHRQNHIVFGKTEAPPHRLRIHHPTSVWRARRR